MSEEINAVMNALNECVARLEELPDSQKRNSHIGKIMAIQGDYAAILAKDEYIRNAPGKRKGKIIEA